MSSSRPSGSAQLLRFIKDLAKKQESTELAQLATRMASVVRLSNEAGEDPFAKVKGLISALISKLEKEMGEDDSKKAYCDRELSQTNSKQASRAATVSKLSRHSEQMAAASAKLKEQTVAAQSALADIARAQAEMDKLRGEDNANFVAAKADVEEGLQGVKLALKILAEFARCAEGDKKGSSTSIIGMLEVVEADFTKKLAELVANEEKAVAEYEAETKDNGLEKVAKDKDVEYMTRESAALDKAVSETSAELAGVQAELDAVLEYLEKLKKSCLPRPEVYATRKQRREAELAGLREAMNILRG